MRSSWAASEFLTNCCVIVEPPWTAFCGEDVLVEGAADAAQVDAVVGVEAAVLDRDDRVLHDRRDLVSRRKDPLLVAGQDADPLPWRSTMTELRGWPAPRAPAGRRRRPSSSRTPSRRRPAARGRAAARTAAACGCAAAPSAARRPWRSGCGGASRRPPVAAAAGRLGCGRIAHTGGRDAARLRARPPRPAMGAARAARPVGRLASARMDEPLGRRRI